MLKLSAVLCLPVFALSWAGSSAPASSEIRQVATRASAAREQVEIVEEIPGDPSPHHDAAKQEEATMSDQREQDAAPAMSDSLREGKSRPMPISESPAGKRLQNFIAAMNRYGDDAQDAYESALEALRENADEVVIEIARAMDHCDRDDYRFRWALVYAAAELRHPAALPLLKNIVLTPIPPERAKQPHSFSTVAQETILRTTAVEGVEKLAGVEDGNEAVVEALFLFLEQPSLSVRRASVQALLAVDSSKRRRDRIAKLLPEDQRFLLDVERKKVQDVPQITEPQRHLKKAAREKDAPPRIPGESEGDAPRVY